MNCATLPGLSIAVEVDWDARAAAIVADAQQRCRLELQALWLAPPPLPVVTGKDDGGVRLDEDKGGRANLFYAQILRRVGNRSGGEDATFDAWRQSTCDFYGMPLAWFDGALERLWQGGLLEKRVNGEWVLGAIVEKRLYTPVKPRQTHVCSHCGRERVFDAAFFEFAAAKKEHEKQVEAAKEDLRTLTLKGVQL